MAHTNHTTNYELSQFVSTDKPAWLGDYNQDMAKIDAGIHGAKSTADGADGKADTNATNIGTLTSLTTDVKTSLVSAINEVDSNADTASGVATQAMAKANSVETNLNKFNITRFTDPTVTGTGMTITVNEIHCATNSDGSIGKIYGTIFAQVTSTSANFTISDTGFRPATNINVNGICFRQNTLGGDSGFGTMNVLPITIHTDGTITLQHNFTATWNGKTVALLFPACVIFASDFGD